MKKTKANLRKVLSTFLAVVMLVSTCSVAFGVEVFATKAVGDSVLDELVTALESDTMTAFASANAADSVINYTLGAYYDEDNDGAYNSKTHTITISDYDTYYAFNEIVALVMSEADYCACWTSDGTARTSYASAEVNIEYDWASSGYTRKMWGENMNSINEELKARLLAEMGTQSYYQYAVDTLIDVVFWGWDEYEIIAKKEYDNSTFEVSSENSSLEVDLTFNVIVQTTDELGYFTSSTTDLEDYENMCFETQYSVTMTRDSDSTTVGSNYVRGYLFMDDDDINSGNRVNVTTVKAQEMIDAIDYYGSIMASTSAAYPEFEDVYNLQRTFPNSFSSTLANMESAYSALASAIGDGDEDTSDELAIFTMLFPDGDTYTNCLLNFQIVDGLDSYLEVASAMETFVETYSGYGVFNSLGFDEATIIADYAEYTANYNTLLTATDEAYEYICLLYGLTETYYDNFTDNVYAYTQEDIKEELDALMEIYGDYTAEDVAALDETTQSVVYTSFNSLLAKATSYSNQIVYAENLFAGDFEKYYLVKSLFSCEVNSTVAYFITMGTADLDDYSTTYLIECLDSFSKDYTTLNSLKTTITNETSAANAATVLKTVYAYADELVERINACLAARFTAQVAYAYEVYYSIEGGVTASSMDVVLFSKLKSSIGAIDADIITALGTQYTTLVDSTTRTNYNSLTSIITIYNTYAATYGFSTFTTSTIDYVDREVESTDIIRDSTYYVDESDMTTLINLLDELLLDPEVTTVIASLIGIGEEEVDADAIIDTIEETTTVYSLMDIVEWLLSDLLFSDTIINFIVGFLYPLVEGEFNVIDLPTSVEGLTIKYNYTLAEIALIGGLAISPEGLATLLPSTYSDAKAALTAAGSSWYASSIYDAQSGSLDINWGVDDYKKANPDATYDEVLDVFVNAMGSALEGMFPLLGALLCGVKWSMSKDSIAYTTIIGVKYNVDLELSASACNGYVNFIGPIFELLGYDSYATASWISSNIDNATEFVEMLFDDVNTLLANLLESPVENILSAIPGVVYALLFDMIPGLLGLLETEITYVASVIGGLIDAIEDDIPINLGTMLNLEDLGLDTSNGLAGILSMFGIELTGLDEGTIATLGTKSTVSSNRTASIYGLSYQAYKITGDAEGVLYYLLTYIIDSVKDGSLYELLGAFLDEDTITKVSNVISSLGISSSTTGAVIAAVVELLDTTSYKDLYKNAVAQYAYFSMPEVSTTTTTYYTDPDTGKELEIPYGYAVGDDGYLVPIEDGIYSEYWTQETAEYVVTTLPQFAIDVADIFFGYDITGFVTGTVDDLLESYITMDTAAMLFDLIDPYLAMITDDETISMIIDIVVVDLDLVDYIDVQAIIDHISTFDYTDYPFDDGDIEGFIDMIVEFIYPIAPVLDFILLDGSISLYGETIVLDGGNGYETAIVPIFEAFGLTAEEMPSYADLCAIAEPSTDESNRALVEAILEPIETFILSLLDSIESEEGIMTAVYNVLDILPNVLYFVEQGGLNTALANILVPVYAVLDTIRPIYNLSFTLDFDLVDLVDDLLASLGESVEGLDEYIIIPSFSELITSIKQISSTEVRTSVTGNEYNYLVVGDAAYGDLVTMLLVEVIDNVTYLENIDPYINIIVALTDFLPESAESSELVQLLNGFAELDSTDQVLFVLYYLVYGVDVAESTLTGFYDLVDGSIAAFLEVIGGFTSAQYIEIADATNELATSLKGQLDEWGADPEQTEAVLTWFEEIIQAIKDFFAQIAAWFNR